MLKREWGAESNGKLPHLIIPGKSAALDPEFCGGRPVLGRTGALVTALALKDLPLCRTLMMMMMIIYMRGVHKVSFPLVPQLVNHLLREVTACCYTVMTSHDARTNGTSRDLTVAVEVGGSYSSSRLL